MGTTRKELNERLLGADLTSGESQAVNYILENVESIVFLNASDVAAACGMSPTSMTRISQKMGYKKSSDFKKDLEKIFREKITSKDMFDDYLQSDEMGAVVQSSMQQEYSNIKGMEENIDDESLDLVASKILEADKVFIIGMFGSEIVVKSLDYYFTRLGKNHEAIMGIGLSKKLYFSDIKEGDVLIAISNQRIFREIMEAVNYANDLNAATVAITDSYTNPLANSADAVLMAPVKGKVFDYSHTATIILVNILCNMVAKKSGERLQDILSDMNDDKDSELFCV